MKRTSKLLLDEHTLQVLPSLAKAIGLNEAIIVQQIHYWTMQMPANDGWIYNTVEQWQEQFPFFSLSTIARTFKSLKKRGLVLVEQKKKSYCNHVNFYKIDYDALDRKTAEIAAISDNVKLNGSNKSKVTNPVVQNELIGKTNMAVSLKTETTAYTTTNTTTQPEAGKVELSSDALALWEALYLKDKSLGALPIKTMKGQHKVYYHHGKVAAEGIVSEDGLEAALKVFEWAYGSKYCQPVKIFKYKDYKARYIQAHGGTGETPDQVNERVARELEAKWAKEAKKELT